MAAALVMPIVVSGPATTATVNPVAPIVTPLPREKPLPLAVDVSQQYQGQSICDPPPKPGIAKLRTLLRDTYGPHTIYTSRACASDPRSEHTEGRALDWMVSLRVPTEKVKAEAFLQWLLATGPDGTKAAMARRLGVMYIGWNNQIWRGYSPLGWGELKGCFSKKARSYDTYCHRDHVHFSMTWDGAAALTSYWDGSTQSTPPCLRSSTAGRPAKLPAVRTAVPLPAVRKIFDTTTGTGNRARICRLQEDRWSGDNQHLDIKVAGKGGVPKTGAVRAKVRLTALDPNAPMKVYLWPTGGKRPAKPAVTTGMNAAAAKELTVKLGAKGSISVATATGDTNVRVQVLGYERAGA